MHDFKVLLLLYVAVIIEIFIAIND
jgi:hypothetical protein